MVSARGGDEAVSEVATIITMWGPARFALNAPTPRPVTCRARCLALGFDAVATETQRTAGSASVSVGSGGIGGATAPHGPLDKMVEASTISAAARAEELPLVETQNRCTSTLTNHFRVLELNA